MRADINPLIFPAGFELDVRNTVIGEGIERYAFLLCVALPIQQDASPSYAMVAPIVLRAFEVRLRANEVRGLGIVVEALGNDVTDVAEAIPLGATLSVEGVGVIVGYIFEEDLDVVLERFAPKTGRRRMVQG